MMPKRAGVSDRTATMAAPGFKLRYSSAICSAGVLDRTTLATSLSARRRSACCASSIPSSMTVGLDMVVSVLADKSQLARGSAVFHRGLVARPARRLPGGRFLGGIVVVGCGVAAAAVASEQEELDVVGIVELVLGRQVGGVVGRHRLGQMRGHHHQELCLVPLV